MNTISIYPLDTKTTTFNNTNISIVMSDNEIFLKSHGVIFKHYPIPKLRDNECIAYVGGWFDCIAVVPNRDGTTDDIKTIFSIGGKIRELDLKIFDIKSCVGCGAYRRDTGIDMLVNMYHIDREIAELLI